MENSSQGCIAPSATDSGDRQRLSQVMLAESAAGASVLDHSLFFYEKNSAVGASALGTHIDDQSLRFNTQTNLNFVCNFVLKISPKG